jgi:formate hydrogenlyase transcriptional activator
MAENPSERGGPDRPDDRCNSMSGDARAHGQYRVLLQITDLVVRSRSLPDLFRELTPPVLALTACDLLSLALYDPQQNRMLTQYWKKDQEYGELNAIAVNECISGWVWKQQEALGIPDIEREERFPACVQVLRKQGVRSYNVLPLSVASRCFGALGLAKRAPEPLNEQDQEFLSCFARMVALALENEQAHETLQREQAGFQALLEVGAALLGSKLELRELSPQVAACLRRLVPHDLAKISLWDETGQFVRTCALEPFLPGFSDPGVTMPSHQCLSSEVAPGEARIFARRELESFAPRFPAVNEALKAGFQQVCALDLSTSSGRVGVLYLASKQEDAFHEPDLNLLKPAAVEVALVVENALTHAALRQEKERLQTLLEVSTALAGSNLELAELFPQIATCIRKVLPHDDAMLSLMDDGECTRVYALGTGVGRPPAIIYSGKTTPMEESFSAGIAAGEAKVFNRKELEDISIRVPDLAPLLESGFQSVCSVSLATAKGRVGVLHLGSMQENAFRDSDLLLLKRVAAEVAPVLENAVTHQALNEKKERLQMLLEISTTLSANLDLKELFPAIATSVRKVVRHDIAAVSLFDEAVQGLRGYALDFPAGDLTLDAAGITPLDDCPSGRAFHDREARIYNRADLQEPGLKLCPPFQNRGVQSLCCVPLLTRKGAIGTLTLASPEDGAFRSRDLELLTQVAGEVAIALDNARAYREIAQLRDRLAQEKHYLESEIQAELLSDDIVGDSPALQRVLDHASIVATTDSTVLITGETGTGKERIARAIHSMSRRKDRSFIKLNCAAIPTGLLESELFGHERGAFTGAVSQKIGRLELADKGTLFLDEIGEIPLELQPKLLRVLQDQEFERLGGTRTIRVDARLIAATNRDLTRAVEEKQFRSDLFYRLHVFPLHLPALRERREDIPLLVRHFVERSAARLNRRIEFIPDEAVEAMLKWSWPGNIRELENFIERSVILSDGKRLKAPLGELRQEISRPQTGSEGTLRERERYHIIEILRQTRGVLSGPRGAATRLGLKRTTLQYKMQKLGISRVEYLD